MPVRDRPARHRGRGRSLLPTSDSFTVPRQLFLGSVCTVTENPPGHVGLADASYAWGPPTIDPPATVVAGRHRLGHRDQHRAAAVGRSADHQVGRRPRRRRASRRRSSVASGRARRGTRRTPVGSRSASAPRRSRSRRPTNWCRPRRCCSIIEDTQDADGLRDGSFAWGEPTYAPDDVTLVAGADRDARRHQHRRPRVLGRHRREGGDRAGRRPRARRPGVHRDDHAASTARTHRSRPRGRRRSRPRRCGPASSSDRCAPRPRTRRGPTASPSPATRRTSG